MRNKFFLVPVKYTLWLTEACKNRPLALRIEAQFRALVNLNDRTVTVSIKRLAERLGRTGNHYKDIGEALKYLVELGVLDRRLIHGVEDYMPHYRYIYKVFNGKNLEVPK